MFSNKLLGSWERVRYARFHRVLRGSAKSPLQIPHVVAPFPTQIIILHGSVFWFLQDSFT